MAERHEFIAFSVEPEIVISNDAFGSFYSDRSEPAWIGPGLLYDLTSRDLRSKA